MKEVVYVAKTKESDVQIAVTIEKSIKGWNIYVVELENGESIWGFTSNGYTKTLGKARKQLTKHSCYSEYKQYLQKTRMHQMVRVSKIDRR